MYVCMYVCEYVYCMGVCMYVCECPLSKITCLYTCMHAYMHMHTINECHYNGVLTTIYQSTYTNIECINLPFSGLCRAGHPSLPVSPFDGTSLAASPH